MKSLQIYMKRTFSIILVGSFRWISLLISLPVVSFLIACAPVSSYQSPGLVVPNKIPSFGKIDFHRNETHVKKKHFQHVIKNANKKMANAKNWEKIFVDPTLKSFIKLALENNRDLRHAILTASRFQTEHHIKKLASSPQLGVDVSLTRKGALTDSLFSSKLTNQYSVGLSSSWEIDLFGQAKSLRNNILMNYFATAEGKRAATISLVAGVSQQYLSWIAADAQVGIIEKILNTYQEILKIQKAYVIHGLSDESVVVQTQSLLKKTKSEWHARIRDRTQAENALTLLLGTSFPKKLSGSKFIQYQGILVVLPFPLMSDCLFSRPDIIQAEYYLRAADANVEAARAAFFPKISLTGMIGFSSAELSNLFNIGSASWQLLPKISLPIFNVGINRTRFRLTKIDRDIALNQYEKTIQNAFREVADSLAAKETYEEQLKSISEDIEAQEQRLQLLILKNKMGVENSLNVLNAKVVLYQANQVCVSLKLAQLLALVSIYQRLGGF